VCASGEASFSKPCSDDSREFTNSFEDFFVETIGSWWMWTGFAVFVVLAVCVDLFVMEKQGAHKVTAREATIWSIVWFSLAFVFVAALWWYLNGSVGPEIAREKSLQFITGYLVEKSLSIDNIFVFLMLFT
jgi:tellurite resistance protein TerC